MRLDDQADRWIRQHAKLTGPIESVHERPWSTVLRVPTPDGALWFKACAPVQAFEPKLSARLFERWPDRVAEVIAFDEDRAWLLLSDAGTPVAVRGNPPELWMSVLPRYAELQIGEADRVTAHRESGVPVLPVASLPDRFAQLLDQPLPIQPNEVNALRALGPILGHRSADLAAAAIPETIQHDDLHMANVYESEGILRILDWGDSSISHPFFSLVVIFRFLHERNGLAAGDAWFRRLGRAYLEPWGRGLDDALDLAVKVGWIAHAVGWSRQRAFLSDPQKRQFDAAFANILRHALRANA